MNREETGKLLAMIAAIYPNFKAEDKAATVNAWEFMLAEYEANDIMLALKTFVNTSNSAFAPSPAELIGLIHKAEELATLPESEAWAQVRKAISKSAYNSQAEFDKLPETVQKAIGSAEVLHNWAMSERFNEGVIMSLFVGNYKAICQREREEARLPIEARLKLEDIRTKNTKQIEENVILIGQPLDALQEGQFDYKASENASLGEYSKRLREELGNDN